MVIFTSCHRKLETNKILFLIFGKTSSFILKTLFSDNQFTINSDKEVYFFFLSYILPLFYECINKLYENSISVMVIYDVMNSLKKFLEIRIKDKFLGFQTNQLIETSINKKILTNDF